MSDSTWVFAAGLVVGAFAVVVSYLVACMLVERED